jgi:hypothetical protein
LGLLLAAGILVALLPDATHAQLPDGQTFLPIVRSFRASAPPRGPGSQAILQAGLFEWDEKNEDPPVVDQPVPPTDDDPNTPKHTTIPGPGGSTLNCETQEWEQRGVLGTRTIVALDTDPAIFPGALIQGKSLVNGELTQIRGIPRAPGVLYLTNLTLAIGSPPSKGSDPVYTRNVAVVDGAQVNEAIKDILTRETLGTAAQFEYSEDVGYSLEQMKFSMGIDGRFGSTSFDADLSIDTDNQKSYSYLLFTQVYYDVVFNSWTSPTSLFRDGETFTDPNDEIGPNNPPLFVEKVSYGRQVLFILESEYSASDVSAAMQAAYDGLGADVNFRADLTYRKVMQHTSVKYRVRGGNAGVALEAINSATPEEMFLAVKESLADKATANYSSSSPGVPIYYTMRYLANNEFATLNRAVRYPKRDCEYTQGPGPLEGEVFYVDGFHDKITVSQTWLGDVNQVQFALMVASDITWWKALEVGNRLVFLETQDQQRGPVKSPQYPLTTFIGSSVPLSFWKAKGIGVHTYLETKQFSKSDLAGYLTTFTWHND